MKSIIKKLDDEKDRYILLKGGIISLVQEKEGTNWWKPERHETLIANVQFGEHAIYIAIEISRALHIDLKVEQTTVKKHVAPEVNKIVMFKADEEGDAFYVYGIPTEPVEGRTKVSIATILSGAHNEADSFFELCKKAAIK
jgi:hypothetical protein